MTIGLDRNEIKTVYEKKYADHLKIRCKMPLAASRVFMNSKVYNRASRSPGRPGDENDGQ